MRYSLIFFLLFLLAAAAKAQQDTLVVHFDIDRAEIRTGDSARLDSIALHITAISLAGHTDNSGTDAHNSRLSLARAQAVRDYLVSKGWPDSLFQSMDGYGSRRPLNENSSAEQKALNRRVEIMIQRPVPTVDTPRTVMPDTTLRTPHPPLTLREIFQDTTSLVGKNIILRNVNFYDGRHLPLPGSNIVLLELAAIMDEYPHLHIEIQGYVCCNSNGYDALDADTRSGDLSVQRAKYIYEFLVSRGVKKKRMYYKGFGSSKKIYPDESNEEERSANRRVEIKIVSFGPK